MSYFSIRFLDREGKKQTTLIEAKDEDAAKAFAPVYMKGRSSLGGHFSQILEIVKC